MIYLWRFFLGCVAACFFGLAALFFIAPLQPGDAPVTGSAAIRTEPEGTDATRHHLPGGASIATPLDWVAIPAEALHQFDRFGLAARAGNDTRILLALSDAEDSEQSAGVLILLDAGDPAADPVPKLQAFVDRIRPKLSQATVIHEATRDRIGDTRSAKAGFRAVLEGRIGRRTVNARLTQTHTDRNAILSISIASIGARAENDLRDMLQTLRIDS